VYKDDLVFTRVIGGGTYARSVLCRMLYLVNRLNVTGAQMQTLDAGCCPNLRVIISSVKNDPAAVGRKYLATIQRVATFL
jgi:hypothetical protein